MHFVIRVHVRHSSGMGDSLQNKDRYPKWYGQMEVQGGISFPLGENLNASSLVTTMSTLDLQWGQA